MQPGQREIAAAFDGRAPGYRNSDWHRRSAQRLVDLCGLQPGDRVLDAGTGTGFAALHAARQVGDRGRVLGVDISEGMLSEARAEAAATGQTNIEFVRADATSLGHLDSASFDVVTCATALLYIPVAEGLREWHRLLRDGGLIAFSTMRAGCPAAGRLFRSCAASRGIEIADPCKPLGSPDACRRALDAAGFATVNVIMEPIEFSVRDLGRAWESNLMAPAHGQVRALAPDALRALEQDYRTALDAHRCADPVQLLRSDMLYSLGRR